MRRFAVIGLGRFGAHLAARLYELGHEVLAVDADPAVVQSVHGKVSTAAIVDARDKQQLRALGLKDFDTVIISVGDHLEASTLAALYCKEMELQVVARAVNEDHGRILDALGVDEVVFPEHDMAIRLAERLSSGNLLDYIPLGEDYSIMELAVPDSFAHKTLAELNVRARFNVHVLAIQDVLTGKVLMAPAADQVLEDTNVLVVLGQRKDLDRFQKIAR
ncbi:MAG: TrkA family potassium uptake protein [Thermoanaerobaculaceae bacterium]|nr:TrkA family potassium uptake protein [Thermoanaerobaculaceae bacterium]MDI9622653.1 TrkA family potassium uptake protein [Acidobacteriota bacterium]NLH10514.1 TrkA family potassium uptake protein [Holophagae bacterium]HPW54598.1 TrkA family potassium uptake protein [Thermoanaerobaculaceae bacterium]